jgi:hypothetical protein
MTKKQAPSLALIKALLNGKNADAKGLLEACPSPGTRTDLVEKAAFLLADYCSASEDDVTPVDLRPGFLWLEQHGLDYSALSNGHTLLHTVMPNGWRRAGLELLLPFLVAKGVPLEGRIEETEDQKLWNSMETPFPGFRSAGQTALLMCATRDNIAGVEVLMGLGANPEARNDDGENFLDICRGWMGKIRFGAGHRVIDYWLATSIGHRQMVGQMEDRSKRERWLDRLPEVAGPFWAKMEQGLLEGRLATGEQGEGGHRRL